MTRRLLDHRALHEIGTLERVAGYQRQRDQRAVVERVRRYDDEPGLSGESAYTINEKGIIVRSSQDRTIQIWTADGKRQFTFGTEDAADGGEPFLSIGEDLDVNGYRAKIHGRLGHYTALAGTVQTATHHGYKTEGEVYARGDGSVLAGADVGAWTTDSPGSSSGTGRFAYYQTAATNGNARGPNGPLDFKTPEETDARWIIQTGSDITVQRIWIGLFASDPSGSSTPAQEFAGFRYVAGTDTTWRVTTGDGANRTVTDSSVAVAANTKYALRIRLFAASVQFRFGIPEVVFGSTDGEIFYTHTTNLPATTTLLASYARLTTLENVAKHFYWQRCKWTTW